MGYKTKTTHFRIQNKIIKNDNSLNTKKWCMMQIM